MGKWILLIIVSAPERSLTAINNQSLAECIKTRDQVTLVMKEAGAVLKYNDCVPEESWNEVARREF